MFLIYFLVLYFSLHVLRFCVSLFLSSHSLYSRHQSTEQAGGMELCPSQGVSGYALGVKYLK
jgi:hypothetical protein